MPVDRSTRNAEGLEAEVPLSPIYQFYISAHTHRGNYIPHQDDDSGWLELNLGSTVDWLLEFRSFQLVAPPPGTGGLFYSNSALFTLGRDWTGEDAPECAPSWQPQRGDPDYYIDYTTHLQNPDATAGFIPPLPVEPPLARLPPARPHLSWRTGIRAGAVIGTGISPLI